MYTRQDGTYVDAKAIVLSPAAALTADAVSNVVELGDKRNVALTLVVSAVSASDTLDVTVQGSQDGSTNWYTIGTFTQVTTTGTERKTFTGDRFLRADYNVGGASISIAFTLTGEAT